MQSKKPTNKKIEGFTLIELMITVAIVAILAAIAYPSYLDQVRKTRRSDAQAALMRTAQILERCYTEYNAYNNANCPAVSGTGLAAAYQNTDEGFYTLSATLLNANAFTLQATPQGDQANDSCGNLTLTHTGQKGVSSGTVADCW